MQAQTRALNDASWCAGAHARREVGGAAVGSERAPEMAQPHLHVALTVQKDSISGPLHTARIACEEPDHRNC
jgi:hypothetical protein